MSQCGSGGRGYEAEHADKRGLPYRRGLKTDERRPPLAILGPFH